MSETEAERMVEAFVRGRTTDKPVSPLTSESAREMMALPPKRRKEIMTQTIKKMLAEECEEASE